MKISAIIPVYNNEKTIGHVLSVVTQINDIAEIIVINDGSTDRSIDQVQKFKKVKTISHDINLGKGAAVVTGWNHASNEVVFGIDGDLEKLNKIHLTNLLQKYKSNTWDMVIAAREQHGIFDMVSGDRIYKKSVVLPYMKIAHSAGNGVEQVINYAHLDKKIHVIVSKGIGHIQRYQRRGWISALPLYLHEGWQFLRTALILRMQQRGLGSRRHP